MTAAQTAADVVKFPFLPALPVASLRDPAVRWHGRGAGYTVFYTSVTSAGPAPSPEEWNTAATWTVSAVDTLDFKTFTEPRVLTPPGFASPGELVLWEDEWLLPLQTYPGRSELFVLALPASCKPGADASWSQPRQFLSQANSVAWNARGRAIDPSLVRVETDDALHSQLLCFFTGTSGSMSAAGTGGAAHVNLLGLARCCSGQVGTSLDTWEMLSAEKPIMGAEVHPQGVENVSFVRDRDPTDGKTKWLMALSVGIHDQFVALSWSEDLLVWSIPIRAALDLPTGCSTVGAPSLWREADDGPIWMAVLLNIRRFGLHYSALGLFLRPADAGVESQWERYGELNPAFL